LRHPILYADQAWRTLRIYGFFLLVGGVSFSAYFTYTSRRLDANFLVFLAYIPSGLLLLGVLQLNRRRSFVEVAERGLVVSRLLSSVVIDWSMVRSPRVQPLKTAFQDRRKRHVNQQVRRLLEKPAVFVRLRGDDLAVAEVQRRLGSQLAYEGNAVLPVPDPEALVAELGSRVPRSQPAASGGSNLGGARRPRRRR
jgi:hypothetical protein